MCFVIGAVDILLHEQLTFAERLKKEIEAEGDGRRLQIRVFDEGFHGWLDRKLLSFPFSCVVCTAKLIGKQCLLE
jgi:hypothetical protein